jgi:hypothetical protein
MSYPGPVEYDQGAPAVRAVYDDIMHTRQVDDVNNFWKFIANHPPTLARTWHSLKDIMAPGALDPLIKELLYVAVSVTNNCAYCVASHTAAARRDVRGIACRRRHGERDQPACSWISRADRPRIRIKSMRQPS